MKNIKPIQELDSLLLDELHSLESLKPALDWEIARWLNANPIFNDPRINVPFYKDTRYDVDGINEMWDQSPNPSDVAMTSTWMYVKGKYITHTYALPILNGKHTKYYEQFKSLQLWFKQLPFTQIDMVTLNFCHAGQASVCHCDFADLKDSKVVDQYYDKDNYLNHDYLLFHSDPRRRFYAITRDGDKVYKPHCRVCTFDQTLDHGVDAVDFFTWSMKVGGSFNDEFRDRYQLLVDQD
jgi:hypothetical protein